MDSSTLKSNPAMAPQLTLISRMYSLLVLVFLFQTENSTVWKKCKGGNSGRMRLYVTDNAEVGVSTHMTWVRIQVTNFRTWDSLTNTDKRLNLTIKYLHLARTEKSCFWNMTSSAVCTNLATYEDMGDQQRSRSSCHGGGQSKNNKKWIQGSRVTWVFSWRVIVFLSIVLSSSLIVHWGGLLMMDTIF